MTDVDYSPSWLPKSCPKCGQRHATDLFACDGTPLKPLPGEINWRADGTATVHLADASVPPPGWDCEDNLIAWVDFTDPGFFREAMEDGTKGPRRPMSEWQQAKDEMLARRKAKE